MKVFLLLCISLIVFACNNNKDQAGATGSGAGIQKEESVDGRMDATEDEDLNITTPIDERSDVDE
jgi:hypothetical protein